jgi:hypothetical protein
MPRTLTELRGMQREFAQPLRRSYDGRTHCVLAAHVTDSVTVPHVYPRSRPLHGVRELATELPAPAATIGQPRRVGAAGSGLLRWSV